MKQSFKQINLSWPLKHNHVKAPLALFVFALLIVPGALSCGKRKPPLPPVERVSQRVDATGFQRGNQVLLSWKMPARNADKNSVLNIVRADVYRIAEPLTAPLTLSETEFAAKSVVIASLPISDDDFGLRTMTFTDPLELANQPVRLRYSVRLVNSQGQRAGFSNFLLIEPTGKVAASPSELKVETTQETLNLKWTAPTANVDGTTPVNLVGFNLYRSASEKEAAKLLTETPVKPANYDDRFFDFDKEYFYFVRAVSVGPGGEPIESGESNVVQIEPKDIFPPSAPTAITVAASRNSISLFFAVNPENDISGYRIYRTEVGDTDKTAWDLLTPELLQTNTFQDVRVEAGTRYFYYLTAVDKRGNVSSESEIVSEIVPD